MRKRLFFLSLFKVEANKTFTSIDAWADEPSFNPIYRLTLAKNIEIKNNTISLTSEELDELIGKLTMVSERLQHSIILSKAGKLKENAYHNGDINLL